MRGSTVLTTESARAREQDRFAKCLFNAYFLSEGDIRRWPVTAISWTHFGRTRATITAWIMRDRSAGWH
jgi:hypothetical protein